MSAYLVPLEHIQYLMAAADHYDALIPAPGTEWGYKRMKNATTDELEAFGQKLWDENVASVEGRYPDCKGKELPGELLDVPMDDRRLYVHNAFFSYIDPIQVIQSVRCYDYQSCEHEGWKTSEAREFMQGLLELACSHLEGYDKRIWGAPEPSGHITGSIGGGCIKIVKSR